MSAMQLGRIWAAAPVSPNIDPGTAKWKLGWVPEIPVFQMLNYINNRYDTNIVSLAERGVFEWGGDVDYKLAAIVWDETDGSIYISKVASPSTTSRPSLNTAQWSKSSVQISRTQYDAAVASWSNHIANTSNPHQLTVDILNTYSKSVIDQKVSTVQTSLNTHTNNTTTNIHNVTAVQTGAVPVTGGSYTGLVKHLFASTGIGATSFAASLLTDSTGTFLALGASAKIGLDSTSKAVFIDSTGAKSNLLIESNYIAAREAAEASYVTPTPDCFVNVRNNLNLIYGSGATTFLGPAGSRGYVDKSGTAQTAALNTPRYTAKGLYIAGNQDSEQLRIPLSLNLLNSNNYSWQINFQSLPTTVDICYAYAGGLVNTSGISIIGGYYVFRSVIAGSQTNYQIAPATHNVPHSIVVTSNSALNTTYVYLDGVLKATLGTRQAVVSGDWFFLMGAGDCYLNYFKTWLSPLTSQQVSNS